MRGATRLRAPWRLRADRVGSEYPGDSLPVLCWCESAYVLVKRRDLLDGRTMPCGKFDCHPPRDGLS